MASSEDTGMSEEESTSANGLGLQILNRAIPPVMLNKRMRWSKENNIDVMKAYYRATKCESQLTGYRAFILKEWEEIYPESDLSTQRICDQARQIIKNGKFLSATELQCIKSNIEREITPAAPVLEDIAPSQMSEENPGEAIMSESIHDMIIEQGISVDDDCTNNVIQEDTQETQERGCSQSDPSEVEVVFQSVFSEFQHVEALLRPRIPKLKYNHITKTTVAAINNFIKKKFHVINTLVHLHLIVYCAATTAARLLKTPFPPKKQVNGKASKWKEKEGPDWRKRLENKISSLRSELTRLINLKNNDFVIAKYPIRYAKLLNKYNLKPRTKSFKTEYNLVIDTIKQKIAASGKRLARYNKCFKRRTDNQQFYNNQKRFYQMQDNQNEKIDGEAPDKEELTKFWTDTWGPVEHNGHSSWIKDEHNFCNTSINEMNFTAITAADIRKVVKKMHNWKSPGPDNIHNYWWKHLTSLHPFLATLIQNVISEPSLMPTFLLKGITYLKAKSKETQDPKNYRPITCLCSLYKLITSVLAGGINTHITENNILAEEQKGCCVGSLGCKEQLSIDLIVTRHAHKKSRNISLAWIDYQKAFDSVPHSWLLEVLKIYKIDIKIYNFLKHCMNLWTTNLQLTMKGFDLVSEDVQIKRGIFQGDTLSPIWFCLAINPLSRLLNQNDYGYKLNKQHNISHLLYMDDLKIYAKNEHELSSLLETTAIFSNDIQMKFGLNKCAVVHVKRGKIQSTANMQLTLDENNSRIPGLKDGGTYKYLGICQSFLRNEKEVKDEVKTRFQSRLKQILQSGLNGKNKIAAINGWCIPILTYTLGILTWSKTDIEDLDRQIRVKLTKHRCHHPKSAKERLYLDRKQGGRGLINIQQHHEKQVKRLRSYFYEKQSTSSLHKAIVTLDIKLSPLNLSNSTAEIRHFSDEELIQDWNNKVLHGRFAKALEKSDKDASLQWLKCGTLYAETEGFMIAIQDEVIATKNHQKYIQKLDVTNDRCRICKAQSETIQHLTAGCSALANSDYLHRHNLSCKIVHQFLANKHNLVQEVVRYYQYEPEPVLESDTVKLYYDVQVITDITVLHNRPDIIVVNKILRTVQLIDVTHPNDHNMEQAFQHKIDKYKLLAEEIKKMWKLTKAEIFPIVVTVNGLVHIDQKKFMGRLDIPPTIINDIQRSVILETCRIVRKALS
jgi:hypothetical protein